MKKMLFLFVLALTAKGLSAQSDAVIQAPDPNAPVISFVETVIDFGSVMQNSAQVRTFTFTNTGKSPLIISSIKGQCGCTTVLPESWSKDPIPPGGTGTFKVSYDTATRVGMFDKKIMIYCNASNCTNGFFEVKVKGNVTPAPPGN